MPRTRLARQDSAFRVSSVDWFRSGQRRLGCFTRRIGSDRYWNDSSRYRHRGCFQYPRHGRFCRDGRPVAHPQSHRRKCRTHRNRSGDTRSRCLDTRSVVRPGDCGLLVRTARKAQTCHAADVIVGDIDRSRFVIRERVETYLVTGSDFGQQRPRVAVPSRPDNRLVCEIVRPPIRPNPAQRRSVSDWTIPGSSMSTRSPIFTTSRSFGYS